jgi:hypothetical protein
MPVGIALEGISGTHQACLVEMTADELKSDLSLRKSNPVGC